MEIAKPWMTFVPCPETEASAIDLTGVYFVEVKYSVMTTKARLRKVRSSCQINKSITEYLPLVKILKTIW